VLGYVELARSPKRVVNMSLVEYVHKRLVTVYPTYVFTIAITAFQRRATLTAWILLPFNIFMMHCWLPLCWHEESSNWPADGVQCQANQWAQTGWFMSVLVLYWMILRPLARVMRRRSHDECFKLICICWAWSVFPGFVRPLQFESELLGAMNLTVVQFGPLGYVHVFVAGVASARLFILAGTVDAVTGEPPNETTERLALKKVGAPFPFRYGCLMGYILYFSMISFDSLFLRGGLSDFKSTVTHDTVYNLQNLHSGLYLNVQGDSKDKGAAVQQWDNPGSNSSQWKLILHKGTDVWSFENVNSGLFLNAAVGLHVGFKAMQWSDVHMASSQWKITGDSKGAKSYLLQNVKTGLYLEVHDSSLDMGAPMVSGSDRSSAASHWRFQRVPSCGLRSWSGLWFAIHNGGLLPVMLLLIFGGSMGVDPIARHVFQTNMFMFFARTSYAQYLLQYNVMTAVKIHFGQDYKMVFIVALPTVAFLVERYFTRIFTDYQRLNAARSS